MFLYALGKVIDQVTVCICKEALTLMVRKTAEEPGPRSESPWRRSGTQQSALPSICIALWTSPSPRAGQVKVGVSIHQAQLCTEHSARNPGFTSPEAGSWGRWQVTARRTLLRNRKWQWAPGQAQGHTAVLTTWDQEPQQQAMPASWGSSQRVVAGGSRPRGRGKLRPAY